VTKQLIMIVEDEIIIARELEMRLLDMGYDVSGLVATGPKAIKCVAENPPNLILMDINLKGEMDGIETAAQIQSHHSIPIIYLTAFTDEKTLERAKLTEPYGYIVKPFAERELHANIEMALYKHNAETKLRKVSRWFAGSINEVGDAVIVTDERGLIDYMNKHAEAITEWSVTEAQGKPLVDVLRLRDSKKNRPIALNDTLATQDIVLNLGDETILKTRTGALVNVDCTTTIIEKGEKQGHGTVSVLRDVSGQMRGALANVNADVAAALGRAISIPEMLQVCAESINYNLKTAGAQIWTVDNLNGTLVLQASAGMSSPLSEKCKTVPIGQSIIGLIAQKRIPYLSNDGNDVFKEPQVDALDWARHENMALFAGYPLLVDDRLVGVMSLFSRNKLHKNVLSSLDSVTNSIAVGIERKEAAKALRESEDHLKRTQAVGHVGSWVWNPNTGETYWSDETYRILSYPQNGIVPSYELFFDRIHPDDRVLVSNVVEKVLHENTPYNLDFRIVTEAGLERVVNGQGDVSSDASGKQAQLLGTIQDITERKQAEEELNRQKIELEVSNKELESYSYSIAHDLRTPLRAITSFSQILMAEAPEKFDAEQLQYLTRIVAAGKNMAQLINDILELSRITRSALNYENVNLSKVAQDIIERLEQEHPDKKVQWQIQGNMFVNGDSTLLTLALQNLLENAWKFTRDKTPAQIEMSEKQRDNEIVFSVKDNGVGFDMEYKKNLFKPFHRLHPKEFEGTGVGLATVHRIIQRHGGRMWVEAEVEQGATFYFTLGMQDNVVC